MKHGRWVLLLVPALLVVFACLPGPRSVNPDLVNSKLAALHYYELSIPDRHLKLNLSEQQKKDLIEYLKSL